MELLLFASNGVEKIGAFNGVDEPKIINDGDSWHSFLHRKDEQSGAQLTVFKVCSFVTGIEQCA